MKPDCSSSKNNIIFLNSFDGDNIDDFSGNIWYTLRPVGYQCGKIWGEGRLGNYWGSYTGNDTDGDGLGVTDGSGVGVTDVFWLSFTSGAGSSGRSLVKTHVM